MSTPPFPNYFNFMQFWGNLAKSYVGAPVELAPLPRKNPGSATADLALIERFINLFCTDEETPLKETGVLSLRIRSENLETLLVPLLFFVLLHQRLFELLRLLLLWMFAILRNRNSSKLCSIASCKLTSTPKSRSCYYKFYVGGVFILCRNSQ